MKYFSPHLLDGSVTTVKLADNSVTLVKMADGAIQQDELDTAILGHAGNVGALSVTNLLLAHFAFWPMIHVQNGTDIRMTGHNIDGGANGTPRLGLYNSSGSLRAYNLDYRYVVT